jgi:hypothetical protein
MFERWDFSKGKFIDVRYEPYDERKYPNREYAKNDCSNCPNNGGIGYDHDSLTCRECSGFEDRIKI